MELFFNYLFAIMQPFAKDGWKVVSIISVFFLFKYWKFWKRDKLVISILTFVIYGIILSLFSEYKEASFNVMKGYTVSWLFSFVLGYSITNEKDKINLIKTYTIVFAFTLFWGFLAYFNVIPDQIGFFHFLQHQRLSVFDGHTELGSRCNFIIIPAIVLFLFYKGIKQTYIFLSIIIYFTFALLLSGTRNCYISLFITFILIICFYTYMHKKLFKVLGILSILLVLFTVTYCFNPVINKRINQTNIVKEKSLSDRITMYKFGLKLITEKPILGFAPKVAIFRDDNINKLPHFHNIYIDILVDFGLIGFILFVFIIYTIFKRLIVLYIKTKSVLPLMLIFTWIAILISDNFDTFLKQSGCAGLYFWTTGLVLSNNYKKEVKTNDK